MPQYRFDQEGYDPRYGNHTGRVKKDDFSIDGKSWEFRNPANYNDGQERNSDDPTYNRDANSMTNALYEYSYGQVKDAAEAQGINNVNSKDEVDRILAHIKNPSKPENNEQKDEENEIKNEPKDQAPQTPIAPSQEITKAMQRSSAHKERMQGDRYNIYGGNQPSQFSERSKEVYDPNIGFEINQQTSVTSNGQEQAQQLMKDKINSTKKDYNFQPTLS